ncbi:hypothetical protein EIP86_008546 [Pleurotus ostreatoroseus]|nr:hypothetical protein EIP86_008546 [Pleurotus ostreatoroseus]
MKFSANKLGQRGVWSIVSAMERNYSLISVESYSNDDEDETALDTEDLPTAAEVLNRKNMLQRRNDTYRKQVEREALDLLRYSRVLLLGLAQIPQAPLVIPIEIQLHVLAFFAPSLTDSQRSD